MTNFREHTFKPDWYITSCTERDGHTVTGGGLYDYIANKFFGANLKDGEIHAPLRTPSGWQFASYMGPGTDVYTNIKNKKEPVSNADRVAQAHDIRYSHAMSPEDVRTADLKMVQKLNDIEKDKSDSKFNIALGKWPIKAKMFLEDMGVMKKGSFSSQKGISDREEAKVLGDKLRELEVEGYGKKKRKKKKRSK